jgi:hypothetical protein
MMQMKHHRQETEMIMAKKRTVKGHKAAALTSKHEETVSAKRSSSLSSKIAAAGSPESKQDTLFSPVSKREKIALLAYAYWELRGCQDGSAEEDWFRAEREIASAYSH